MMNRQLSPLDKLVGGRETTITSPTRGTTEVIRRRGKELLPKFDPRLVLATFCTDAYDSGYDADLSEEKKEDVVTSPLQRPQNCPGGVYMMNNKEFEFDEKYMVRKRIEEVNYTCIEELNFTSKTKCVTALILLVPAGIFAKVHYGTSLSNVDWLHGGVESLLTLSNLFVVLGLREAIREDENAEETETGLGSDTEKETSSSG